MEFGLKKRSERTQGFVCLCVRRWIFDAVRWRHVTPGYIDEYFRSRATRSRRHTSASGRCRGPCRAAAIDPPTDWPMTFKSHWTTLTVDAHRWRWRFHNPVQQSLWFCCHSIMTSGSIAREGALGVTTLPYFSSEPTPFIFY